jgi:hypothetical protein
MSKQLKVVSKGYTVTCTSWENDGDNYNTNSVVVEEKEMAEALYQMCKVLFQSEGGRSKGIGNSCDRGYSVQTKIAEFIKQYPILMNEDQVRELIEIEDEEEELEFYEEICNHWKYELLGSSEYYYCRVAETTTVTYSPEDIFVEQIF